MYSMRPAEVMRYGRAYAVDTLIFAYSGSPNASGIAVDQAGSIAGGFFEFSRGLTPDSMQAEQRGLLFDELRGFASFAQSGMVSGADNPDIRSFAAQPSPDLIIRGAAATGFYIRHPASGFELLAPPLRELGRFAQGEVRGAIFAGAARVQNGPTAEARQVSVLFERLYLPAVNLFDENAAALWAQRARAWLLLPGAGGQLLLAREDSAALARLYTTEGRSSANFARLVRGDTSFAASFKLDAATVLQLDSAAAEADPAPLRGRFELLRTAPEAGDGAERACDFELPAARRMVLPSISRADSTLRLITSGQLRCSRRTYPVFGLLRSWPAVN